MKKLLLVVILLSKIGFSQNGENPIFDEVSSNDNVNLYFQLFAWDTNEEELSFLANCDEDMVYTVFIPGEEIPGPSAALLVGGLMNPLITYINYYIHPGELILDPENTNTLLTMLDGNQAEFYCPINSDVIVGNATIDNISIIGEIPACNGIIYIIDDLLWAAPGCTDPDACNYDPDATVNDQSCDNYSCLGCTDDAACNYNPDATIEDNETCEYPGMWWLDVNADGCGNECAGDIFGVDVDGNGQTEGLIGSFCEDELPILSIPGWPNATWANNGNCNSESIVNIDGILEDHWCLSIHENKYLNNTLVKKIDILGRDISNQKGFQLEIYDNGTIKKTFLK